jgi:hypothetical protein
VKLLLRVGGFEVAGVVRMDFGPGTNVSRVLIDEQRRIQGEDLSEVMYVL